MGFDDFFEHDQKHHKHSHDRHYRNDDYSYSSHSHNDHDDLKYQILAKLKNNPGLRKFAIIAGIFIVLVIIIIVILLIPLIIKLFHFIGQNGIQGVIDAIWKGTK